MKIAGMTRVSSYDIDKKKCVNEMKFCISELAKHCDVIYFMTIGDVDFNFFDWLNIKKVITKDENSYVGEGWNFDWTRSMTNLLNTVDESYDWILCPDTDDALPANILTEVEKANLCESDMLECPVLECFGSVEDVICKFDDGYPIGPHIKAFRYNKDLTFIGSPGFSMPVSTNGRVLKNFHSKYPCRHVRYSNPTLIENRKNIGYYQEYFLKPHPTVKYDPKWIFDDYVKYGMNIKV